MAFSVNCVDVSVQIIMHIMSVVDENINKIKDQHSV